MYKDIHPVDLLNISFDWTALETALDTQALTNDLVSTLPPLEDNEDFWTSRPGQFFGSVRQRRKTAYSAGFVAGNMDGDTVQLIQTTGRKPPSDR